MGSFSVVLSIVASSSAIIKIYGPNVLVDRTLALCSLGAAILTGLMTFNRYSDRASQHYDFARKWEKLRDEYHALIVKMYITSTPYHISDLIEEYRSLSSERENIRNSQTTFPRKIFLKHYDEPDKAEDKEETVIINSARSRDPHSPSL